jgi:hypothetical protein
VTTTLRLAPLTALVACMGLAIPAQAEEPRPAQWTLDAPRLAPETGAFVVTAVAQLDPGWRLYSLTQPPGGPLPTRLWLPPAQPWSLAGAIRGPEPTREFDPAFGMEVESHTRRVEFVIPVERRTEGHAGGVQVKVRYQLCSRHLGLPPQTVALETPVSAPGAPR